MKAVPYTFPIDIFTPINPREVTPTHIGTFVKLHSLTLDLGVTPFLGFQTHMKIHKQESIQMEFFVSSNESTKYFDILKSVKSIDLLKI